MNCKHQWIPLTKVIFPKYDKDHDKSGKKYRYVTREQTLKVCCPNCNTWKWTDGFNKEV